MDALFRNILTASFHGSIVILAVLLLRLVLKKTPRKYICMLWLLAVLRLLLPFQIQSNLSLQPSTDPVALSRQTDIRTQEILNPLAEPDVTVSQQSQEPITAVPAPTQSQAASSGAAAVEPAPVAAKQAFDWVGLLPWLWLGIGCCFGIYSLYTYLSLKRKVREAIKIPGGWECDRIDTAFILGFIRPKIYIPMGMPKTTRKYILDHERTHLEKGDHWFKMVGFVALALHWFNPLVWAAYILLCKDIEIACDERVVQFMELEERKEYSAALLSCSTNRAHFAACPVAFGEVSVKERIKSVLSYKKPGFWISLVGVVAIAFVAVCLMTSPAGDQDTASGDGEPAMAETAGEAEADTGGFTLGLEQAEIADACQSAIDELKARESYSISVASSVVSTSEYYGDADYTNHFRRHGENRLNEMYEADGSLSAGGGDLVYDGRYAWYLGDQWCWQDGMSVPEGVNGWLDEYAPANKTILFPEGTGVISPDTVSYQAEWTQEQWGEEIQYSGLFTFTFQADGTLSAATADYVQPVSEEDGGGEVRYIRTLTVMDEAPEDTAAAIQAVADTAMTPAEVEEYRILAQQVSEVPSNKTSYDKDFALGSAQMGWNFLMGKWFFKFGAEDVTDTGCRLVVEYNGPYGDSSVSGGTMEAGTEYFLERLVNNVWETVPTTGETFSSVQPAVLGTGSSQSINWENNYGPLPAGFYRIGNYYTFTADDGTTDPQVCYAKFRLYDPNQEALLAKCRTAVENLVASDSYHVYSFDWLVGLDYEYYLSQEVWKHGPDYLSITRYPSREDLSQMLNVGGALWRDGRYYGLDWSEDSDIPETYDWWSSVDGYMDDTNFTMWSWDFDWSDAQVDLVYEDGNKIHILERYDFSDRYQYSEITLTFDNQGNIAAMTSAYLPSLNSSEAEKVTRVELVVLNTTPAETAAIIDRQDVSHPMDFSYSEDVRNRPDAQTEGFRNTTAKPVGTIADAIALADKECTMDNIDGFTKPYFQTKVYHDDTAGMWKVELYWWQDDDRYQAIYMTDDGVTQRIVTGAAE